MQLATSKFLNSYIIIFRYNYAIFITRDTRMDIRENFFKLKDHDRVANTSLVMGDTILRQILSVRNLIFIILLFVFTGCVPDNMTPPMTDAQKDAYLAKHSKPSRIFNDFVDLSLKEGSDIKRIPEINIKTTAEVGDNMYQKINSYFSQKYDVKLIDANASNAYSKMNMILKKDNNKHNAICEISTETCLIDTLDNGYFNVFLVSKNREVNITPIKYTVKQQMLFKEDAFKYIVLYQGKIGNNIKISFREFKENMSRPAFTQDIDYELNKNGSTIIGFKGLRIEVLGSTNLDITYKIIQDYK